MAPVPEHELVAVKTMTGYDQILEIDRLCKVYGVDQATLQAAIASAGTTTSNVPRGSNSPSAAWDTSHKDVPGIDPAASPTVPRFIDKQQLQFEYDPSREAAQRREQVKQAILCPACGVALGIPDIRPIKVTCPACMFETTYTH